MPLNTCSWAARASGPRTGTDFILLLELGSHLGGEILRLLLDSFTQSEAQEARQPDRRADLLRRILNDLGDAVLAVDDEELLKQDHFLVEFAQPTLDHLGDNVGGLARLPGLLGQHGTLALDCRLVEIGHVLGYVPADLVQEVLADQGRLRGP